MSKIRLWQLGHFDREHPEKSIIPTKEAVEMLRSLLAGNTSSGTLDIVWGPDLTVQEFDNGLNEQERDV